MLSRSQFIRGCAALGAVLAAGLRKTIGAPSWPETPADLRLMAMLRDGRLVAYRDLRLGDEFQAIMPNGTAVDPFSFQTPAVWCRCTGDPIPSTFRDYGYVVMIETIEPVEGHV